MRISKTWETTDLSSTVWRWQKRRKNEWPLKDIHRVVMSSDQPWNGLSPDGSSLIMREVGSRELYSLELQLP
jgi:hypothetical protein